MGDAMSACFTSRFARYTLALAITAVVVGSVWATGNRPDVGTGAGQLRIDVSALMSSMDVGKLTILNIAEPL
jgi:hypothetical protein